MFYTLKDCQSKDWRRAHKQECQAISFETLSAIESSFSTPIASETENNIVIPSSENLPLPKDPEAEMISFELESIAADAGFVSTY